MEAEVHLPDRDWGVMVAEEAHHLLALEEVVVLESLTVVEVAAAAAAHCLTVMAVEEVVRLKGLEYSDLVSVNLVTGAVKE